MHQFAALDAVAVLVAIAQHSMAGFLSAGRPARQRSQRLCSQAFGQHHDQRWETPCAACLHRNVTNGNGVDMVLCSHIMLLQALSPALMNL